MGGGISAWINPYSKSKNINHVWLENLFTGLKISCILTLKKKKKSMFDLHYWILHFINNNESSPNSGKKKDRIKWTDFL